MTRKLIPSALLAAAALVGGSAGLALPTAALAQPMIQVQIGPPPPPRMEVVPVAQPGYVWSPGHYQWMHGQYVWRRGHWVAARPGYVYQAPAWNQAGGQWVYRPGTWVRDGNYGRRTRAYGDRDRDGVPNRYDRDRDGDRVPNRYDRAPNNPRRY